MFDTKKEAIEYIGRISQVYKMPCKSFNLPATECHIGKTLVKNKRSTCFGCYATKHFYNMPTHIKSMYRNFKKLNKKYWVQAFKKILEDKKYFRWHDSGDIKNLKHLVNIARVCRLTPDCKHWLPTREIGVIKQFFNAGYKVPSNLTIRISAYFTDMKASNIYNLPTSTVHDKKKPIGHSCKVEKQGGKCLNCRNCWNKQIKNISYKLH